WSRLTMPCCWAANRRMSSSSCFASIPPEKQRGMTRTSARPNWYPDVAASRNIRVPVRKTRLPGSRAWCAARDPGVAGLGEGGELGAGEEGVEAGAAVAGVHLRTAVEVVVVVVAVDLVAAFLAVDGVVAVAATALVVAGAKADDVVAGSGVDGVVAGEGHDEVIHVGADDGVVHVGADDEIPAGGHVLV